MRKLLVPISIDKGWPGKQQRYELSKCNAASQSFSTQVLKVAMRSLQVELKKELLFDRNEEEELDTSMPTCYVAIMK